MDEWLRFQRRARVEERGEVNAKKFLVMPEGSLDAAEPESRKVMVRLGFLKYRLLQRIEKEERR